jgi:hypothetical protein
LAAVVVLLSYVLKVPNIASPWSEFWEDNWQNECVLNLATSPLATTMKRLRYYVIILYTARGEAAGKNLFLYRHTKARKLQRAKKKAWAKDSLKKNNAFSITIYYLLFITIVLKHFNSHFMLVHLWQDTSRLDKLVLYLTADNIFSYKKYKKERQTYHAAL